MNYDSKAKAILTTLQGCNSIKRLKKIHACVIVNGLQHQPAISNKLLNFCAVSVAGSIAYAEILFRFIQNPQTEAWNSLIRGYAQGNSPLQALRCYNGIRSTSNSESRPDTFTFSFALKACEIAKIESKCGEIHVSIIRHGYERDVVVCTNLIRCYSGNRLMPMARRVFDNMNERDLVSWNSMVSCYSKAGFHHEALKLYSQMKDARVGLDGFTLVTVIASCTHVADMNLGRELHGIARRRGLEKEIFVANALIDMYAKLGRLDAALTVFNGMRRRDVSSWNSIIVAFGVHGYGMEAISFSRQMLAAHMRPNAITFLGLLYGCSHQGLLEEGVEYFNLMTTKFKLKPSIKHYGCLVDLFGRAGKLEKALEIAMESSHDDPVLWRTLLGSCKVHRNVQIGEIAMKNLIQLKAFNAGDYLLMASIYAEVEDRDGAARMRTMMEKQGLEIDLGWSCIDRESSGTVALQEETFESRVWIST